MSAATVTPLRSVSKTAPTGQTGQTGHSAANALWFRLDQARAVAQCIPQKCDVAWELEGAVAALAQVMALAGAVTELLDLALADVQNLEQLI